MRKLSYDTGIRELVAHGDSAPLPAVLTSKPPSPQPLGPQTVTPLRLRLQPSNLQAVCTPHYSLKTTGQRHEDLCYIEIREASRVRQGSGSNVGADLPHISSSKISIQRKPRIDFTRLHKADAQTIFFFSLPKTPSPTLLSLLVLFETNGRSSAGVAAYRHLLGDLFLLPNCSFPFCP